MAADDSAGVIILQSGNLSVSTEEAPEAVRLCIGRPMPLDKIERAITTVAKTLVANSFSCDKCPAG